MGISCCNERSHRLTFSQVALVATPLDARFAQMAEAAGAQARWPSGKQRDIYDNQTRFIYACSSLCEVRHQTALTGLSSELSAYAEKRWVNFVRHDSWLQLFLDRPECEPWPDPTDRNRDLLVFGTTFDLKVTRYPNKCSAGLSCRELATWYYENQSQESRFHLSNRLFVCASREADLYDLPHATAVVEAFLTNYESQVMSLHLEHQQTTCAVLLA